MLASREAVKFKETVSPDLLPGIRYGGNEKGGKIGGDCVEVMEDNVSAKIKIFKMEEEKIYSNWLHPTPSLHLSVSLTSFFSSSFFSLWGR